MKLKIPISAVVITYNEAHNIVACLESLVKIADEIVVVDSGSTDQTVAIAQSYGASVYHQSWLGYAEQKNWANSKSTNDWIISLDADEVLSDELIQEIKSLDLSYSENAYALPRLTNYCGTWIKHGDWYPDYKIRLWHKNEGKWVGYIHESISLKPLVKSVKLKNDILHYSYRSILEHLEQMKKFTVLMAEQNVAKVNKVSVFKLISSTVFKFLKSYIIKKGFLDGYAGLIVAMMSAYATFLKYAYTRELLSKKI
jgi:glycosyltransferase involved in cell wall biosynthesis